MSEIFIQIPSLTIKEGSSFNATAYFRSGDAASAPTTARYRVDCLTTGKILQDWASIATPAANNTIAMTATFNAIQNQNNRSEIKQLTVETEEGTDAQTRESLTYLVENIRGF